MSGEGIVLPPLPPPERAPEVTEASGEGLRVVRRPARVWVEDEEPAYVGAPPTPVVGRPVTRIEGARGGAGELPPPSHVWDDVPGTTGFESDPFAEPPPAAERPPNVRARWIAGSVVVVLLGVLALAVRHRSAPVEAAAPEVTWRLPTPVAPAPGADVAAAPAAERAPSEAVADAPGVVAAPAGPGGTPTADRAAATTTSPPSPAEGTHAPTAVAPTPAVDPSRAPVPALGERRHLAGVPRTAPSYSAGDGLLVVTANQQGTVWIDGVDAGPLDGFVPVELPAGRYPVEVRTPYATRALEVRVDPGSLRRVQVDFAPAPALAPSPVLAKAPTRARRHGRSRRKRFATAP